MRVSQTNILEALGCSKGDLAKDELCVSLRNIEKILDKVASNIDNDFESASLGDASNLVQLMRESL